MVGSMRIGMNSYDEKASPFGTVPIPLGVYTSMNCECCCDLQFRFGAVANWVLLSIPIRMLSRAPHSAPGSCSHRPQNQPCVHKWGRSKMAVCKNELGQNLKQVLTHTVRPSTVTISTI